jgi:lipopolysaccharide assembly outer membrane protein LptD (OstA)
MAREARSSVKPILLLAAISLPWAIGQENKPEPLHLIIDRIHMTASSIQRDGSVSNNPELPAVYLRGNVEIRKEFCVPTGGKTVCNEEMVLRADEAEYHPDTGEITPSGNVRVAFEELK